MSDNEDAQSKRNWPPIAVALGAQVAAFALCFGLAAVAQRGAIKIELPLILAAQGLVAAVLSHHWGLARWWLPLQMVMPIAAGAALMLALPSWIYLALFVTLLVVFWNASGERVPLYLTNRTTWQAITDLIS